MLEAHSTHCEVVGSHSGAAFGQSAAVLQPTQVPALVQIGLVAGQWVPPPLELHEAWHV